MKRHKMSRISIITIHYLEHAVRKTLYRPTTDSFPVIPLLMFEL